MTEASKRLEELLKGSALSTVHESEAMKKMLELTKASSTAFELPRHLLETPKIEPFRPPNQKEVNAYQSAGVLVRRLAETVTQWRKQVPPDSQPAIIAILQGGIQVSVSTLAEESFHGIRIEGTIDGSPCIVLTHQASVQLLCFVAKVEKEEFRRKIGFIIDGEEQQL